MTRSRDEGRATAARSPEDAGRWSDREDDRLGATTRFHSAGGRVTCLAEPPVPASVPEMLGRYRVTDRIGVGGMSVVYEATDPELHRRVALKVLRQRTESPDDSVDRRRLLREAQALARLSHPNVITIYDVGICDGQLFLAMEYVEGRDLRTWLRERVRPRREILDVFVQAGRGLRAAHDAGLVHRDFKPENVLVGADGRVRVLDLGLARAAAILDIGAKREEWARNDDAPDGRAPGGWRSAHGEHAVGERSLTKWDAIVGTPRYMAPEQHLGLSVSPRTDQFAFCVALFEALFGCMPFEARSYQLLAAAVTMGERATYEPGDCPEWLLRIIDRGLRVEEEERYPGMRELLSEIDAALGYEEARASLARAELEGARGAFVRGDRIEARAKLRHALEVEDSIDARALWWSMRGDPLVWRHDLGIRAGRVCFSPDGKTVAVAGTDGSVYLIDPLTLTSRVLRGSADEVDDAVFSRDGHHVIAGDRTGTVRMWTLQGHLVSAFSVGTTWGRALEFLGVGRLVVGRADGELSLWDLATGTRLATLGRLDHGAASVCADVSGAGVAAVDVTGGVRWFPLPTASSPATLEATTLLERRGRLHSLRFGRFSPDGRSFATPSSSGLDIEVYRWSAGRIEGPPLTLAGHTDLVSDGRFCPDGRRFVSSSFDRSVRLWDLATGSCVKILGRHASQVFGVDIDPTGRYVVSGRFDLRLWDIEALAPSLGQAGHVAGVLGVDVSSDGKRVATGGHDRSVRIWDLETGDDHPLALETQDVITTVAFGAGDDLFVGGFERILRSVDASGQREDELFVGHRAGVAKIRTVPSQGRVYSTGWDGTLREWEAAEGSCLRVVKLPSIAACLAVHPLRDEIAVSGWESWIAIVRDGEVVRTFDPGQCSVRGLGYSADGRLLAFGGDGGRVMVVGDDGVPREVWSGASVRICGLAFSRQGERLAIASSDGRAVLCSVGRDQVLELEGHPSPVNAIRFTPDGRHVVTVGADKTVRLWCAVTGRPVWRGVAFLRSTGEFVTHRGVTSPRSHLTWRVGAQRWQERLCTGARRAAEVGEYLFVTTDEGTLELWNRAIDDCVRRVAHEKTSRLLPAPGGCLSVCRRRVVYHGVCGRQWTLEGVVAVAVEREQILVATEHAIQVIDAEGHVVGQHPGAAGVTALGRIAESFVLGFHDGSVELLALRDEEGTQRVLVPLESKPSCAVSYLRPGPFDTIVIGYESGVVGIWSLTSGKSLLRAKLHGCIRELELEGGQLQAMSELGSTLCVDLSVFEMPYDALLDEVRREIAIVWENGRAVVRHAS